MEFITILKLQSTFSIIKLNTFFVISNQNDIDYDSLQEKESIILSSILFFCFNPIYWIHWKRTLFIKKTIMINEPKVKDGWKPRAD